MKKIGFLSFGHWSASPYSQVRSASDALLQSIELAEAVEELGADGAYFRVHHFAQQLASPFPLLAVIFFVFAGVLMTFVPATSDYVNSELLGSSETTMIGQVIQSQFLSNSDYPSASALSFTLMTVLLIGVFAYARALGTEDVMKVAAR